MPRPRGLKRLVDDGLSISKQIRVLEGELDQIKGELKEYAKANGDGESTMIITGSSASALVYHSSSPGEAKPKDVWAVMKPNMEKFFDVVKVSVTELRKAVSKDAAKTLISSENQPYSRIKFAGREEKFSSKMIGRLTRKIQA